MVPAASVSTAFARPAFVPLLRVSTMRSSPTVGALVEMMVDSSVEMTTALRRREEEHLHDGVEAEEIEASCGNEGDDDDDSNNDKDDDDGKYAESVAVGVALRRRRRRRRRR
mmetsp:Transcript_7050/g.15617  ORF Transcript_7050/g.15617 Transcript_7050/m.15617 type:complete len:112 (-) Transcript_7050:5-340(-)